MNGISLVIKTRSTPLGLVPIELQRQGSGRLQEGTRQFTLALGISLLA